MVQVVDDPKSLPLNIPEELGLQVTPAQFAVLAAENRDLRLERTAKGILIVNPPTGGESGNRNFNLTTQLGIWCEANDTLGIAFDSSTGFELPNGANRSPDASWVTKARWESLTQEQRQGFIPLCPDFVVELRSKIDSLKKLREKMQEYMENGAQLGWLIDPQNKRVEIYRSRQPVEVLENPSNLSGETVLPGFTLSLQRIFPS
ncbi:Uma2 family endonuclease [Synechocystis salina LEGE 06099]|uniref:Uma2 family endonuclease n=1 Tax=Synechocystis salina TaxID=945780 RepID=UPI00187DF72C|nr:Uma2 family endonuclease [Synechocystis salina]MBE9203493.1 Uma2 family endonuclease [Synechocystis salina LEGE 06099]